MYDGRWCTMVVVILDVRWCVMDGDCVYLWCCNMFDDFLNMYVEWWFTALSYRGWKWHVLWTIDEYLMKYDVCQLRGNDDVRWRFMYDGVGCATIDYVVHVCTVYDCVWWRVLCVSVWRCRLYGGVWCSVWFLLVCMMTCVDVGSMMM